MRVALPIIATNAYFVLGLRFINRFTQLYKGAHTFVFYFFSDKNPSSLVPDVVEVKWVPTKHDSWVDASNSKFTSVLSIPDEYDYLYYFDVDTNINSIFSDWFIGDLVGGEHFAYVNKPYAELPFEKKGVGRCNVLYEENKEYTYYYGAFFGGTYYNMRRMCASCKSLQDLDHLDGYEAGVNDESYINHYFHNIRDVKTVKRKDFPFVISCKGGLNIERRCHISFPEIETQIARRDKNTIFDIRNGSYV